jgi:Restriction alleviation protein Lar
MSKQMLEPCPFCKSEETAVGNTGSCWVRCLSVDCGAEGPVKDTEEDAIAAWNGRCSAVSAAQENLREAWSALGLIRETIETLGPVGALQASEHLDGPTFMHEADALVAGIQAMCTEPQTTPIPAECETRFITDGDRAYADGLLEELRDDGLSRDDAAQWFCKARVENARRRCQAEIVPVPKAALDWLFGEGAGPDGKWFGDDEDTEQRAPRKYSRAYWWRSKFRSMVPALTRPQCGEGE